MSRVVKQSFPSSGRRGGPAGEVVSTFYPGFRRPRQAGDRAALNGFRKRKGPVGSLRRPLSGSTGSEDQDLQLWLPLPGRVIVIDDWLPSSE